MMVTGHLLVATGGYLIFKEYTYDGQWVPGLSFAYELVLVLLGCLLPDVDTPDSSVGRRFRFISMPLTLIFGHRGIFHSLLACAAIVYLSYTFQSNWLMFIAGGYLLHLVGDYLTPSGIPLMYPSKKRYRFLIVTETNSISEKIVSFGILIAGIYYALII
jgi:inner membrane protein